MPIQRSAGERSVEGESVEGTRGGGALPRADHAPRNRIGGDRLIPALPSGPFVIEPEDIDRFYVRVQEDGTLFFKGSRARIEQFLQGCADIGLELRVSHIAFCG